VVDGNMYVSFNMICHNGMRFVKVMISESAFFLLTAARVYHDLRKGDGILEHSSQPCKRTVPTASVCTNKNITQVQTTKEQKAGTL
jgi:hypothetical protein